MVVTVLNAIFAFAQEYRADRSAERLRSLVPMSARVRRDGQLRVIDATSWYVIAIVAGALLGMAGLGMGLAPRQAFLFAVGVDVALIPEVTYTVILSLARGASLMAGRNALVRQLVICTDKTGILTQNRMAVVEVWTPAGTALLEGTGYAPTGRIQALPEVIDRMRRVQKVQFNVSAAGSCSRAQRGLPKEARWKQRCMLGHFASAAS